MCFRVSDIPDGWSEEDLRRALKTLDPSLDDDHYDASLYPACHGSRQVAIIKTYQATEYLKGISSDKTHFNRIGRKTLSIDRHFHGLTPLNTPPKDVDAEYIK
jgi:hypothetical protein